MRDIESEQAIVVGCIARDAYAVSAGSINNISAVDTHIDKAVVCIDVAIVGRSSLIDIIHIASRRVGGLK